MKTQDQIHELLAVLNQIAGMAMTGRETVSEITGMYNGAVSLPSRRMDSAAAVTRGAFMAIGDLASGTIARHALCANIAQAEHGPGMEAAMRIIEKVGTTGIEHAHADADAWLKRYYPSRL